MQEIVKALIVAIKPVELAGGARQHVVVSEVGVFLLGWKKDVPARGTNKICAFLDGVLDQADERLRVYIVGVKYSAASAGRERCAGDELGVVVVAILLVGIGPGPVEDILAVGIGLLIQRHNGNQFIQARVHPAHDNMTRLPTSALGSTARILQSMEKLVAHKGVVGAGEAVPVIRSDRGDGVDEGNCEVLHRVANCRLNNGVQGSGKFSSIAGNAILLINLTGAGWIHLI